MSEPQVIEHEENILAIVADNPAIVLLEPKKFSALCVHIKAEIEAFKPDVTTIPGRKAIASFAYKIARTETAIDTAGKDMNADARAQIKEVNTIRNTIKKQLDELKDTVRRPLNEWEEEEKAREQRFEQAREYLVGAANISMDDSSEMLVDRLGKIEGIAITEDEFGEEAEYLQTLRAQTVVIIKAAIEHVNKKEADRAELERLRVEAEERKAADKAKADADAKLKEEERLEQERLERDKQAAENLRLHEERVRQEAAEEARQDAIREAEEKAAQERVEVEERERKAREDIEALEREKEAERVRHEEEIETLRQAQEEREDQERADKEDEEARERDQQHRVMIMGETRDAIVALGVEDETAGQIVLAIKADMIPHVHITF